MSNFPTSLDDSVSLPDPGATDKTNSPSHAGLHGNTNAAIEAIEAKLGIGATMPANNTLLIGTGAGASAWGIVTSEQLLAAVTGETGTGALVFANTPTLNTPKVDTINENTSTNGVTIDGLNIKDGKLNTNDSVTSVNITDGSITNAKLSTSSNEIGGSWQSWTPSYTNLTVGSGTVVARYRQIGKVVFFRWHFTYGTGSAVATGPVVSFPVTSATYGGTATRQQVNANVAYFDTSGAASYSGICRWNDTSSFTLRMAGGSSSEGNINSSQPFVWATGDEIHVTGNYEAA